MVMDMGFFLSEADEWADPMIVVASDHHGLNAEVAHLSACRSSEAAQGQRSELDIFPGLVPEAPALPGDAVSGL
jgi:hypothetical protein